jgi:hypothetical protein
MLGLPLWFKIALGFSCFFMITGTYRRISMNKIVSAVNMLPNGKKKNFVKSYRTISKTLKILFYMAPLNLIIIPYTFYKYDPNNFLYFLILECIVYIVIIDDYSFRRSVLKKIKEGYHYRHQ